ncbi:MFS transporter [Microbacterium trichothecenolyticum]|uniref:MFS transporter n=1 Tax=Microbacterium trichothecenolyticum TaxID=69370 RepID=UPI001C6EA5CB|nr:MFS transporter [Microbacterium trichothecenolyticum]MBW9122073.1 MFS transporter [Microbacterium trichothecenolyticum]
MIPQSDAATLEYEPGTSAYTTPIPTKRVSLWFLLLFAAASTGAYIAVLSPAVVTLALKTRQITDTPEAAAEALGLVAGVGAFLAVVANPLFGRLSDNTTARMGMRRPWMLGGFVLGVAGLALMGLAPDLLALTFGWCIAQLGFNAVLATQVAVLYDRVPVVQRGLASGLLGLAMPIALSAGAFIVQAVAPSNFLMFVVPGLVGGVFVVAFALILPDRHLAKADQRKLSIGFFLGSFFINPVKYPDFTWTWVSRFLFFMAYAILTTYQTFYLIDHLREDESLVPTLLFAAQTLQSAVIIVLSLASGRLSDYLRRRKVFVIAASLIYGIAMFVIAGASDYGPFLAGMAISGVGFGIYFAIDLALVADVMPDGRDTAKAFGVFNVAGVLPQSVAPPVAALVLAVSAGSYAALYMVAGALAVLGALAILAVRSVK